MNEDNIYYEFKKLKWTNEGIWEVSEYEGLVLKAICTPRCSRGAIEVRGKMINLTEVPLYNPTVKFFIFNVAYDLVWWKHNS